VGDERIAVVVIDDHPVFRQGLVGALEAAEGISVLGAFATVEAVPEAIVGNATVVLLDLLLPGVSGAAAVRSLEGRGARVLVVSVLGGRGDVLAAVSAGASGYLTKSAHPEEIVGAIRTVAVGGSYISPTLASLLLTSEIVLTGREREVLALLAEGERDADIARELGISIKTVQGHLDRIRDKTGMRRRAELTRYAVDEGLIRRRSG